MFVHDGVGAPWQTSQHEQAQPFASCRLPPPQSVEMEEAEEASQTRDHGKSQSRQRKHSEGSLRKAAKQKSSYLPFDQGSVSLACEATASTRTAGDSVRRLSAKGKCDGHAEIGRGSRQSLRSGTIETEPNRKMSLSLRGSMPVDSKPLLNGGASADSACCDVALHKLLEAHSSCHLVRVLVEKAGVVDLNDLPCMEVADLVSAMRLLRAFQTIFDAWRLQISGMRRFPAMRLLRAAQRHLQVSRWQTAPRNLSYMGVIERRRPRSSDQGVYDHIDAVVKRGGPLFDVGLRVNIHHLVHIDEDREVFELVFDVILEWEDPLLINACSKVFFADGQQLFGIIRQNPEKPETIIVEKRRSSPHSNGCYPEDSGSDSSGDGNYYNVEFECPLNVIHHIDTPQLEALSWSPIDKFTIGTVVAKETIQNESPVILKDGKHGKLMIFRKYIAEFKADLDMRDFPFDSQELKFNITTSVENYYVKLSDSGNSQCRIEKKAGAGWLVDEDLQRGNTLKVSPLNPSPKGPNRGYWQGIVRIFVRRRPGYYLHNYAGLLFLLTFVSFGAFAVPITDVAGRGGITMTMFLTVVSFKLLMSQQLPRKPYTTWMENYVVHAFVLASAPFVGQVLLLSFACAKQDISSVEIIGASIELQGRIIGDGYDCDGWVIDADRQLLFLLVTAWGLLHIVCGGYWFRQSRRPTRNPTFGCPLPTAARGRPTGADGSLDVRQGCGPGNRWMYVLVLLVLGAIWASLSRLRQSFLGFGDLYEPWAWVLFGSAVCIGLRAFILRPQARGQKK